MKASKLIEMLSKLDPEDCVVRPAGTDEFSTTGLHSIKTIEKIESRDEDGELHHVWMVLI